uniref:Fanconi-associated nuclease n=1 Tax=Salarias fasciatus TaxID=181472 RepID=A0A672ITV5_SALFA
HEHQTRHRYKQKRRLSLSKSKKGDVKPITSFFLSQPPPRLACPLCGHFVPRFKINEHIDLQCQKFERGDASAASASTNDVSSGQLSPTRSPPKSPELAGKVQEEVTETKTSPYFKKNNSQPPVVHSKTVVRTIDLGSLSSKLSRNCQKKNHAEEKRAETCLNQELNASETLNSSQKENVSILPSKGKRESDVVTACSVDTPISVDDPSSSEKRYETRLRASKSDFPPKQESVSSKVYHMKSQLTSTSAILINLQPPMRPSLSSEEAQKNDAAVMSNDPEYDGETPTGEQSSQWLPYYLRNFRTVLQAVLDNEDDRELFNEDDMAFIYAFEKLSVMGQKLYVRLFQRKLKWLQVNKLDYAEISSDLGPTAQELIQGSFLQTEADLEDLGEALDLLPAPELKALAKTFHLGNSGSQKQQLVDGLLRLSKQKSLFSFAAAQNNIGSVILKRAKQLAGSCVRLCRGPRAVFSRVLLLFSLTDTMDEEETAAGGQSQLYTILLVNSGRLAFPDFTVQRRAKLFQDREDLIRYEAAMRALQEVTLAMQGGQWERALELYTAYIFSCSHQEALPVFLRSFTTGWAYTRILSRGVEILQRLRRYEEAVEELRALLSQSVYCMDSRGRWWDRLALNLHQHLKKPEQAIHAIRDGLLDPLVRTGHKLSLHQRAVRMKESPSCKKYRLKLRELPAIEVQDVKHVTIRGQLFPHEGEECDGATVICSVEELCLAHYRQQGFDQGIHGEGSTFSTLFALLLWDIIFMEGIPDVFRNPYQTCPLDLHTDCFYESRKEAIVSRVHLLSEASVETLNDMLEEVWNSQEGKVCSLVNWERFSSLQQAQSLVACFGGGFLGGVISRMAKDYRHCRGGLPDLVVWNTSDNSYKLVEVKGPRDRLSQKQQIWLDELQKLGADVEVCHVTDTGARGSRLE